MGDGLFAHLVGVVVGRLVDKKKSKVRGKQINVRGGYKPLGFRSPWWTVVNHFQTRIWPRKGVIDQAEDLRAKKLEGAGYKGEGK